ncbi:putative mitochondrial protein [Cucumis melo var. makuwa]|uniref:Mitochondrial protein n=1 Tax=Cucumis melo var. makuwa TaxID=1194695 RepID=A0A5A7V6M4_CUCMM|nr:putative mitochondrial protein [Cucumis melo var. makuwa]
MVLLPTILTLKSLVVLVLFSYILMNTLNLNHVPSSVVFLAMTQNIKAFVVGILFPIDFVYLAMSHFGSIPCSLACSPSTPPSLVLNFSSLTHMLTFFLSLSSLLIMSLLNLHLLLQPRTSRPSLMIVLNLLKIPLLVVQLRPTGCKWIYKIKTHSDGTIEHYKTRLVAKRYSQEYGIYYEETFAHVARMTSVRSLLAVAAAKQWPLLQMDVKNAFLNETLFKEVYMKPPSGTSPPPHKAIFDLQHYLGQHFEMKDLGSLNYFLGLEVSRRSDGYLLSQAKYVSDLLVRSRITDSNTTSMPLDPNVHLTPYDGVPLEDVSLYRQLVGSLIYLTMTRPDIAYAVHILLADMGVPKQGPTLLHCDNRSAIQIAHNDVFHERTKHIENDCHFIRHHLLSNTILLQLVSTIKQPADIFTKTLPPTRFNKLLTKLKLTATLPP